MELSKYFLFVCVLEGQTGSDPHNYSNLQEVWPWEHEAVDKSRHTGYEFLKWKNLQ